MSGDTLQEVTEVAVIRQPRQGVLLLHSPARRWHFPDATVRISESWEQSLRRGVESDTGITDLVIRAVLRVQNFAPGIVHELAQYGVFFLCSTQTASIRLGAAHDRFCWVKRREELAGLDLFHPLVAELVVRALQDSQEQPVERQYLNPPELPDWSSFFTQVVCVESHGVKHVHIAGQVGVDAQKRLAGDGGFEAQTERSFDNLGIALAHAGAQWADVVMLTIYVVRYEESHAAVIGRAIRSRFAGGKLPACSLIGVQALAEDRFLIEVEAVALAPSDSPAPSRGH
jgi:enamine deaminase RidA (YjgF/YER057c/UK114 family)